MTSIKWLKYCQNGFKQQPINHILMCFNYAYNISNSLNKITIDIENVVLFILFFLEISEMF